MSRNSNYKEKDKTKKSRPNGKGHGKNRREDDPRKPIEGVDSEGRSNNPLDYVNNAEIARQASQLSFQNVLGMDPVVGDINVPTVMRIRLNPSFGSTYFLQDSGVGYAPTSDHGRILSYNSWARTKDKLDAVNMMGSKCYTLLSTFSGRTSAYSPSDITLMIGAIASIAEYSEHLRRAFGVLLTYNARNRALPKTLIEMMGIEFDDLAAHVADYRMRFNVQIARINQVPLLDNIGFIRKCRDIYQKVFADSPTSMYQMYVMVPNSVWKLDESSYTTGSALISDEIPTYTQKMSEHLDRLEGMISAVLMSTTMQLIYADLLNLATKMKISMWKFDYLSETYIVEPVYDRNFLLQIHNSAALMKPKEFEVGDTGYYTITSTDLGDAIKMRVTNGNDVVSDPDTGRILYNPVFDYSARECDIRPYVIDFDVDVPSPADIIDGLRYSAIYSGVVITDDAVTNSYYSLAPILNDHYIVGYDVCYAAWDSFESFNNTTQSKNLSSGSNPVSINMFTKFNMAPLLFYKVGGAAVQPTIMVGDVNFYTTVDYNYLSRISQLFFTGLFDFTVGGSSNTKA